MLGAVRFITARRAIGRQQKRAARDGRRLVKGEPTLVLRGMLAKTRVLLELTDNPWRREDLLATRDWITAELERRGELPPHGVCAFCLGALRAGRCVNHVCQTTLRLGRMS